MTRSYASAVIDGTPAEVWSTVRDFNGLPDWFPGVARSEIEGGLASDQTGAIRNFFLNDGTQIRERLLDLSDDDMTFSYRIELAPFPIDNYVARLRCHPVTDTGMTFVEWYTDFDCDRTEAEKWSQYFADGTFAVGLEALASRFGERHAEPSEAGS